MRYIFKKSIFITVLLLVGSLSHAQIVGKLKAALNSNWKKTFNDSSENHLYLFAGGNFSRQRINTKSYASPFNYNAEAVQQNNFKTGFELGFRVDGRIQKKHLYALGMQLNKYTAGAGYHAFSSMPPFLGSFTSFKADAQFLTISISGYYKKLLPIMDTSKHRFYLLVGPNFEKRISNQSLDNQVFNAYRQILVRGDLGVEFDNNGYYTLYLHYHQPFYSFTNHVKTAFTSISLGVILRASDLF